MKLSDNIFQWLYSVRGIYIKEILTIKNIMSYTINPTCKLIPSTIPKIDFFQVFSVHESTIQLIYNVSKNYL
jgi:hypothetical protein